LAPEPASAGDTGLSSAEAGSIKSGSRNAGLKARTTHTQQTAVPEELPQ